MLSEIIFVLVAGSINDAVFLLEYLMDIHKLSYANCLVELGSGRVPLGIEIWAWLHIESLILAECVFLDQLYKVYWYTPVLGCFTTITGEFHCLYFTWAEVNILFVWTQLSASFYMGAVEF